MQPFLNKSQLCKRWDINYSTLESRIYEGWIKPVKPNSNFFSLAAIEAAERAGLDEEQCRPLIVAKLRKEIEYLQKENAELRGVVGRSASVLLPYIGGSLARVDAMQLSTATATKTT